MCAGYNVKALRNDKMNPNYRIMMTLEKTIIRSLTDFLRDVKWDAGVLQGEPKKVESPKQYKRKWGARDTSNDSKICKRTKLTSQVTLLSSSEAEDFVVATKKTANSVKAVSPQKKLRKRYVFSNMSTSYIVRICKHSFQLLGRSSF